MPSRKDAKRCGKGDSKLREDGQYQLVNKDRISYQRVKTRFDVFDDGNPARWFKR